jgi:DNA repair protein RecO (recombination protein O)
MKQIVSKGIVLSRTNFGEADRILTAITPDNGKVRLMARGVRKVKSKLAGGIELFSVSNISFIVGRGEIRTLTSTRLEHYFKQIVQDVDRTMYGYEVLKTLDRVTEDEAGEEYFMLAEHILNALNDPQVNLDVIKLWFYMQLLKLGGHSPNLETDVNDTKLAETQKYTFNIDKMAFAPQSQGPYSSKHIKLLRLALSLKSPRSLKQVKRVDTILPSCLQLIKNITQPYL